VGVVTFGTPVVIVSDVMPDKQYRRERIKTMMELGKKVNWKGKVYEVIGYIMGGTKLYGLTLKNDYETIRIIGERQCKKAKVVR
jgi:hypothetical protein